MQVLDIGDEIFGGFAAIGFVAGIGFVAKGGGTRIEGNGKIPRLVGFDGFEEGFEEAETDAGGNPRRGSQSPLPAFGKGVVGAKSQGMAVDEEKGGIG